MRTDGRSVMDEITLPVRAELPPVRYTGRPVMAMIAEALGYPDCCCNYEHCGCDWPGRHPCETCDCGHSATRRESED